MTTQTHEERKAIAHAAIDGAEIEYLHSSGCWESAFIFSAGENFYLYADMEYRVKPERKPNVVVVGYCEILETGLISCMSCTPFHQDTHIATVETDPNEQPPKVVNITLEPLK